jgi:hypothetical protein
MKKILRHSEWILYRARRFTAARQNIHLPCPPTLFLP